MARTCGDGCCALHSIWGVPTESPDGGCWLYCEDARERLLDSVTENADELLEGEHASAFRRVVDYFWVDLVRYAMQLRRGVEDTPRDSLGAKVVWDLCDVDLRTLLLEHADIKRAEDNEQRSLEDNLLNISSPLFTDDNEGLVRQLCQHLKYVGGEHVDNLGTDRTHDLNLEPSFGVRDPQTQRQKNAGHRPSDPDPQTQTQTLRPRATQTHRPTDPQTQIQKEK